MGKQSIQTVSDHIRTAELLLGAAHHGLRKGDAQAIESALFALGDALTAADAAFDSILGANA